MSDIKVKGYPNGIIISYNQSLTFDEMVEVTKEKFASSRKFFGKNTVCIIFDNISFTDEQEDILCQIIKDNTDLDILCVYHENGDKIGLFNECIRLVNDEKDKSDIYFIKESIINEGFVKSSKDIVIIGDVYPGATVVSEKNVYIFGGLYGTCMAGFRNEGAEEKVSDKSSIVTSCDMSPEKLLIDGIEYENDKKTSRWGIKPKLVPAVAFVKDNKVIIENYSKDIFDRL